MQYTKHYDSPLGGMLMACDDEGLTGLWFDGQKYFAQGLDPDNGPGESKYFDEAEKWLDEYFAGKKPDKIPKLHLIGTAFQIRVWNILPEIPYGKTTTYGEIAARLAAQDGKKSMSAQAVGGAVGHNPISVIVPCHRVVGANGSLTGYAGGVEKKEFLLIFEKSS